MDITLINTPQFSTGFQVTDGVVPPIGLLYISSLLKKNNFGINLIDGLGEKPFQYYEYNKSTYRGLSPNEIIERIPHDTKIIGITCMFSIIHSLVMDLCNLIKKEYPDSIVVLGGAHVTALPEYILKNDSVDFICLGESEFTFLKLCEALKENKYSKENSEIKNINGVGYKIGSEVIVNKNIELLKDIDCLPYPDWDSIPMENYFSSKAGHGCLKYDKWTIMLFSRGCPYNCSFCTTPKIWKREWRSRDPKRVVDEIRYLQEKFGIKEIHFEDDNMNTSIGKLNEFCDELIRQGIKINWQTSSGIRPHGMSNEIISKMVRAGCTNITLAPESGSKRVLDKVINKSLDLTEILSAAKSAHKSKLKVGAYFIMGLPGERISDLIRTIRFLMKLAMVGVDECVVSMFAPLPGSKLFDQLCAEGKIKVGEDFFESLVAMTDISKVKSWSEFISDRDLKIFQFMGFLLFHVTKSIFHPFKTLRSIFNIISGRQELKTERFILLKVRRIKNFFSFSKSPKYVAGGKLK